MTSLREREGQLRALLIKRRKAAGLTQAQVAGRLGKPQSFVAKYEGGHRRLHVSELLTVADAIGFDPAYLVKNLAAAAQAGVFAPHTSSTLRAASEPVRIRSWRQ